MLAGENVSHKSHLLVIDDEEGMCLSLKNLMEKEGFLVSTARSALEGLQIIQYNSIDMIISDIIMPDMSGLVFLSKLGNRFPVIMITAYASIESARKAFKLGACDYLVKPFEFEELLVVINQNLNIQSHTSEVYLKSKNASFLRVIEMAEKFSCTDMPILICGESGTGKEVLANYIHRISKRSSKPFIKINCSAIPETLLESELFGYEKGAFTGAYGVKIGKFEEADEGTILLDEIGDMNGLLQAKILRVLQDFEFSRLGGQKTVNVDIRIITASNKNLNKLIQRGEFRSDLYHRLNGLCLSLPTLRERSEDILDIVYFFMDKFNEKYGKNIREISSSATEILASYQWPGNVRELKNCLERATVICEGECIDPEHLPDSILNINKSEKSAGSKNFSASMKEYRDNYMRKLILDTLKNTSGSRAEAAKILNISRKTLYNWMKSLEIRHDFA